MGAHGMLTHGIAGKYKQAIEQRTARGNARLVTRTEVAIADECAATAAAVFEVSLSEFLSHSELSEEVFGPTTLLVHYGKNEELLEAAQKMHGHLTATIHGTPEDLGGARDLIRILETKVGRLLFNGMPTGVEVCHAMVHGGPFPATSDSRTSSVGTLAILRFARPVCYQDFPDSALPPELQKANPLNLLRMVNGAVAQH
jgi:NADP-dependent aldehyde dehydrogenase